MINTATTEKKSTKKVLKLALSNRKTGFMLLLGFASGLPFALFLGTLYAWLTEAVAFRSMLTKSVVRMYGGQEPLAGMSFTTIGLTVCLAASSSGASIGLRL